VAGCDAAASSGIASAAGLNRLLVNLCQHRVGQEAKRADRVWPMAGRPAAAGHLRRHFLRHLWGVLRRPAVRMFSEKSVDISSLPDAAGHGSSAVAHSSSRRITPSNTHKPAFAYRNTTKPKPYRNVPSGYLGRCDSPSLKRL